MVNGALAGIEPELTKKMNVWDLFSAHVHYFIGNKNGCFLVSSLKKANRNYLLIVISKSLICGHDFLLQLFLIFYLQVCKWTSMGFEVQVFEVTENLKL